MSSNGAVAVAQQKKSLVVGVADMIASSDPTAELVTHSLGSCLGVVAYDPVARVGGLLHVMLPDSQIDASKAMVHPQLFVDTGATMLFQTVCDLGAESERLLIKVAGGAEFLGGEGRFNIGGRNIRALHQWMTKSGHHLDACALGGRWSRSLRLEMSTGLVSVQSPGENSYTL